MKKKNYKYIYGPVPSWRLGISLGIDPLSQKKKICTFDCIYCQIGRTRKFTLKRRTYVPPVEIAKEVSSLPPVKIDYLTFSGRGESTLAKNLGEVIYALKKIRKEKIAVLTNSTLLSDKKVRENLKKADFVIVKLDAPDQKRLQKINRPAKGLNFKKILSGILRFKKEYGGRFGLQIMFMSENRSEFRRIAVLAEKISPDEVQINTPLRPCPVNPLSRKEIGEIVRYFRRLPGLIGKKIISVYEKKRSKVKPISMQDTIRRRGKNEKNCYDRSWRSG